jgi:shikimate kinase
VKEGDAAEGRSHQQAAAEVARGHLVIFLVGYRGSGKTTVARLLAGRLGWQWLDADVLLEERAGRSIRRIFEEEGEAAFRRMESELLDELCGGQRQVIATGGGIVLSEANRRRLREAGCVVWLDADATTLWQRMREDATTAERRPNLTVGGLAEVEQLLRAREPFYRECAALRIDTTGRTPEAVVEEIIARSATCLSSPPAADPAPPSSPSAPPERSAP